MKYLLLCTAALLFSCTQRDKKMCDCLETGDKLNKLSSELLQNSVTKTQKDELFKLRAEKDQKCKDFQTMSGEEMLKKKATCE